MLRHYAPRHVVYERESRLSRHNIAAAAPDAATGYELP